MAHTRTIRVGAAQLPGLPLERAAENLARIEQAVAEAGAHGLHLLVLPECAYPAFDLGSVDRYRAAGTLGNADLLARLSRLAVTHKLQLVCGFIEDDGTRLYNSAVVFDAKGRECGRHRKSFLWGEENDWISPGETIAPIDTPLGRIGVLICADGRAPEIAAGLVAAGARLLVVPTCWVNVAEQPGQYRNAQAEYLIAGRVMECRVPLVAADKFGRERAGLAYVGTSLIFNREGQVLAQGPPDGPALLEAEVTLGKPPAVTIPFWAERRLFAGYPPVPPELPEPGPTRVAVVPGCLRLAGAEGPEDNDLLRVLADQGVRIVAANLPDEDAAERMDAYGRSLGLTVVGYPFVERMMCESFGTFGAVAAENVYSFVAARLMALDGAAIIFVMGREVQTTLLRTRATENRVFVAAAFESSAVLVAPTGEVLDFCPAAAPRALVLDVDLHRAADKTVYPGTHIWEQRKPRAYKALFGVATEFPGVS